MNRQPKGFLSYARADDRDKRISRLRDVLCREIGNLLGKEFEIYQDARDLGWGEDWLETIDGAIDTSTFMFPIITPRFFQRRECCRELERFLANETRLGGTQLVMPIYFIACPQIDDPALAPDDPLVRAIARRQRIDWCEQRLKPMTEVVERRVQDAARQVVEVLRAIDRQTAAVSSGANGAAAAPPAARPDGAQRRRSTPKRSRRSAPGLARELSSLRRPAVEWLVGLQDVEGDTTGGWGQFDNSDANSLNTAEVVLALVDCGADRPAIDRGLDFLVQQQLRESDRHFGDHAGAWGRRPKGRRDHDFRVPDTVRTAYALMALCAGARPGHAGDASAVRSAVARLFAAHGGGPREGWAYRPSPEFEPAIFPTTLALSAVLAARGLDETVMSADGKAKIASGMRYLHAQVKDRVRFGNDSACKVAHSICAVKALAAAREAGFGKLVDEDQIARSKHWLKEQVPDLPRFPQECIRLAQNKEERWYNYNFTHHTPALYISAFAHETAVDDPAVKICVEAILRNHDPHEHGFSAARSLSWASARCVSAAKALDDSMRCVVDRG